MRSLTMLKLLLLLCVLFMLNAAWIVGRKIYKAQRHLARQFEEALTEGDLDFLENKWLKVEVRDLALHWYISNRDGRLVVSADEQEDVSFSGNANDLVLIAARKEDPDTLFFQRRLRIEGDTELGLYVKNLMDSIDLDGMPPLLRSPWVR